MKSLNNCVLCAIDVETTGLDHEQHEIIELAVLPLDNHIRPSKQFRYFHCQLSPENVDAINLEAVKLAKTFESHYDFDTVAAKWCTIKDALEKGIEQSRGVDMFVEWFESLQLKPKKRLIPLAHNWPFDRMFLYHWLGPTTFEYIFDPRYRDTMCISAYYNDLSEANNEYNVPFVKQNLNTICSKFGIERMHNHNALDDAVATAEAYRKFLYATVDIRAKEHMG